MFVYNGRKYLDFSTGRFAPLDEVKGIMHIEQKYVCGENV